MTTSIFTRQFNSATSYVRNRYTIWCLKQAKKQGFEYVYYNGGQGLMFGIAANNFTVTREKAVSECASDNDVTFDAVDNDYDNWYYVVLIDEEVESLQYEVDHHR